MFFMSIPDGNVSLIMMPMQENINVDWSQNLVRLSLLNRAGNSLIGFPRKSLVFCPKLSNLNDWLTIAHFL